MKLSKEQRAYRSKPAPAIYTGPNRGHNTPRDVLAYIERQWERHQPEDVDTLAAELGYDQVALHKLKQRHGTGLRRHLQAIRRGRADTDRFLAKQQGRAHPEQYAANRQGAIDDAPAVPEIEQARITRQAKEKEREAIGDLLVTLEDLRAAVQERLESNPEAVRIMGRDAWALRSKIDSVQRRLKRRHAA